MKESNQKATNELDAGKEKIASLETEILNLETAVKTKVT